ncbi:DUF6261 family protein [Empedobacter tilapiae]
MKIALSNLTTKNLATLTQRLINSSKTGNYTIIENHPLLLSLEISYSQYDSVYSKLTYSGKGESVAELDKRRDLIFRNMKAYLNAYRRLNTLQNYQDAEELYSIFRVFGLDIDSMSYSAETAQLKKLIEELDKTNNLQRIIRLSLLPTFDEMKEAQIDFEIIFAEQAEANAGLRQLTSASSFRKELEKELRAYLNLIIAMKDVSEWSSLYYELNEVVKSAKNSSLFINKNEEG